MRVSVKQRETEAKALRLFVASSLIGSLVFHVGLLASLLVTINIGKTKVEDEPIELTFIDPPQLEEKKIPPKVTPPKPQKIEPPKPEPKKVVTNTSEIVANSQNNSAENRFNPVTPPIPTPEISQFKPPTPQKPIRPKTKVEPTPTPKAKKTTPQVTKTPQKLDIQKKNTTIKPKETTVAKKPDPQPKPQPKKEVNEDLKRSLTQKKDSGTQREVSIDKTPAKKAQPTQRDSEKLKGILAEGRKARNNQKSEINSQNNSQTNTTPSVPVASKPSTKAVTNSNSAPQRRSRSFATDNAKVATAPTTSKPVTGNSFVGGDGRAACRRCRTSYPSWAKRRGIEGRITVAVNTDPKGNVTNVQLISSSGNNRLDREHLKLARRWKFKSSSSGRQGVRIVTNYVLK